MQLCDFAKPTTAAKIVLIGESSVGKSSITTRVTFNHFVNHPAPTVGAAFSTKTVTVDNKTLKLEIWDTAGQERFHCIVPMYYRDAKLAIVVYDITDMASFERAKSWIRELEQKVVSIQILLVGNKIDMTNKRAVPTSTVTEYLEEKQCMYQEVSAKTGDGIDEMVAAICNKLMDPNYTLPSHLDNVRRVVVKVDHHNEDCYTVTTTVKRWWCCGY